ncbi:MAG: DUF4214 domain-containing protein, partial [Pirellulales bacterium]
LQPKGVATDDRGYVYSTLNSGVAATSQEWAIYNSDLTPVSGSPFMSATTNPKQLSGMAVQKLNGHYYAYISSNKGDSATIERWNVDNPSSPTLDTSWGTNGIIDLQDPSFGVGSNAFINGLVVDTDGTVYATGGVDQTSDRGDAVFKISPDGKSLENTTTVAGAMDDAIYGGRLFVTEYEGPNSAIAVLNESDLSLVDTITDSPKGPYTNITPDALGYDAGYSGIDIGSDGKIYVAEQLYQYVGGTYSDRILVSSPLVAPSVTSADTATFTPNTAGSFTVTTAGSPTPSLSETGALPSGVTFVDNHDGTATLAGTPAAGSGGTYTLTISAQNYLASSSQTFTLIVQLAPSITSGASTTFTEGTHESFSVTTTGAPAPALTETGALPSGVTFVDNGNGTATLGGTPASGTSGTYPLSITASNGVAPNATQSFTLTVNAAPRITSAAATSFLAGASSQFTVTATGSPTPALSETGALPSGVTFVNNGNGSATLSGTPAPGAVGAYPIVITAANGVAPNATQNFTLTVAGTAPAITSASSATFAEGSQSSFTITATGVPTPAIDETGALPSGLTFVDNGNGTATLSGTPAIGSAGVYSLTIVAHNGVGTNATQSLTLTVTVPRAGFYLAGVPGDGATTTFIQNLYRELLGREPEAEGATFWNAYLEEHDNANGREQAIAAFLNSPEYKEHYITVLYDVFLGRAPDASGLQFWVDKMGDPGTPGEHGGSADEKYVMAAILGSSEFYANAGGTPQGFVTALYKDLLDRAPDSAGLAGWSDRVNSQPGNRDGVVRDFLSSPEFEHLLLDTFYPAPGGTASTPLPAPGTPVAAGSSDLALLTGDGWENLYFEGPFDGSPQGNDAFFSGLNSGIAWDDLQLLMLNSNQYYTNPNRPITL